MKNSRINEAKHAAKRFIEAVEMLHQHDLPRPPTKTDDPDRGNYTKESSAVRRASMDLTRALARMRQGK